MTFMGHWDNTLYLAIDRLIYEDFFQRKSVQAVIKDNRVFLMVVDTVKEELVKWLTWKITARS